MSTFQEKKPEYTQTHTNTHLSKSKWGIVSQRLAVSYCVINRGWKITLQSLLHTHTLGVRLLLFEVVPIWNSDCSSPNTLSVCIVSKWCFVLGVNISSVGEAARSSESAADLFAPGKTPVTFSESFVHQQQQPRWHINNRLHNNDDGSISNIKLIHSYNNSISNTVERSH